MKCPSCGHNHPAREGTRCSKCRYEFVFQKGESLRDNQLVTLVKSLSDNGRLAFTRYQLAMGVIRRIDSMKGCLPVILGLVAGALGFFFMPLEGFLLAILALLVGMGVCVSLFALLPSSDGDLRQALKLVDRYHRVHPIKELATGGAYAHPDPSTRMEPGYAPERVLVVEREDLVDALIRSGFHRDQRCVVVTVDGYPAHVFAACREFIQRHPQLPVYLLHDASKTNQKLLARVSARPEWQFAKQQLRELGIGEEQLNAAGKRRLPWLSRNGKTVQNTTDHQKMLAENGRLLVDYASPTTLHGALAKALVAGILLLPEPVPAGDSGGPDGGSG